MTLKLADQVVQLKRKSFIGQAVVLLLGLELLFFSAFVSFSLPTATGSNLSNWVHDQVIVLVPLLPNRYQEKLFEKWPDLTEPPREVRYSLYCPQVPAALLAGYVLGPLLGAAAAFAYLLLGLIGPWLGVFAFAAGGGVGYYTQPGFGYLLGLIAAAWCVGYISYGRRSSLSQLLAAAAGLLTVHICGLVYLIGSCFLSNFSDSVHLVPSWQQWLLEEVRNLSWYQLPYDALFTIMLIALGFPARWLSKVLTAPDIAVRPKGQPRLEEYL